MLERGNTKGFKLQTTLAFAAPVADWRAMDVGCGRCCGVLFQGVGERRGEKRARVAMRAWRRIHEVLQKEKDDDGEEKRWMFGILKHGSAGRTDVG